MEYSQATYFTENEYDYTKGFTILDADDGIYHIAEKWLASEDEDATPQDNTWISYQVSERDLLDRIEEGHCEKKGELTDEQFAAVCEKSGWAYDEGETPKQTA